MHKMNHINLEQQIGLKQMVNYEERITNVFTLNLKLQ